MAVPFEQNNKERLPYLHYLEELKKLGREDIIVIVGGVIPAQDYEFLYNEIHRVVLTYAFLALPVFIKCFLNNIYIMLHSVQITIFFVVSSI